ncbi:MAG: elongation factor G, partial [Clostridium chrysemydis]
GDINKKRGRVMGMEPSFKMQKLLCEVPSAELFRYATDLRSITQVRGSFKMTFERYEEVPITEVDKIISNKESE